MRIKKVFVTGVFIVMALCLIMDFRPLLAQSQDVCGTCDPFTGWQGNEVTCDDGTLAERQGRVMMGNCVQVRPVPNPHERFPFLSPTVQYCIETTYYNCTEETLPGAGCNPAGGC